MNSLENGTIVFLDLDNFKGAMNAMEWTRYRPNPITGYLTTKILEYIRKYQVIVYWGLNRKEGTEETILFFYQEVNFIYDLMDRLRKEIQKIARELDAPTSLSIGMCRARAPQIKSISAHSTEEFKKDPAIYLAYKALKKAKRKGGNCIMRL